MQALTKFCVSTRLMAEPQCAQLRLVSAQGQWIESLALLMCLQQLWPDLTRQQLRLRELQWSDAGVSHTHFCLTTP